MPKRRRSSAKEKVRILREHLENQVPRGPWLEDLEKQTIIDYKKEYPYEGYRRLTYMMLDEDVVAVSPAATYRVLRWAGLTRRWVPMIRREIQLILAASTGICNVCHQPVALGRQLDFDFP